MSLLYGVYGRGFYLSPSHVSSTVEGKQYCAIRARPLTLHSHMHPDFNIRDAIADVGKCPTQPGITQMWM